MAATAWVTWLYACVRYWAGRGLVYVCPCNYFSYFIFLVISNLGKLESGMRTITYGIPVTKFTQTAICLSYDSRYNNQGLQT